jgi:RNA polymerase sigma factor (sigma-70 family)
MENEKLLRKLANSYSLTTGVEFADLFQEACIAYLEAMKTFDPQKAKLSTYIWHCVSAHLKNYVKLEKPYLECVSIEEPEVLNKPGLSVTNFWEALSFEAQQIVKITMGKSWFNRLPIYDDIEVMKKKKVKKIVTKEITKTMIRRGWDEKKIKVGLQNLQLALS